MEIISISKKDEPRARVPRARGTAASLSLVSEPATDVPKLPLRAHDREVAAKHEYKDEWREQRGYDEDAEHHRVLV